MRKRTRKNFPGWIKARREVVLARFKERLAMPDKEFRNTCKKFHKCSPNAENKKDLDTHRSWLKGQVEILIEKLKRSIA